MVLTAESVRRAYIVAIAPIVALGMVLALCWWSFRAGQPLVAVPAIFIALVALVLAVSWWTTVYLPEIVPPSRWPDDIPNRAVHMTLLYILGAGPILVIGAALLTDLAMMIVMGVRALLDL